MHANVKNPGVKMKGNLDYIIVIVYTMKNIGYMMLMYS